MGSGAAAASSAKLFPGITTTRGGASAKKVASVSPLGVFVQTVMDARRHLVAAAGKSPKKKYVLETIAINKGALLFDDAFANDRLSCTTCLNYFTKSGA